MDDQQDGEYARGFEDGYRAAVQQLEQLADRYAQKSDTSDVAIGIRAALLITVAAMSEQSKVKP